VTRNARLAAIHAFARFVAAQHRAPEGASALPCRLGGRARASSSTSPPTKSAPCSTPSTARGPRTPGPRLLVVMFNTGARAKSPRLSRGTSTRPAAASACRRDGERMLRSAPDRGERSRRDRSMGRPPTALFRNPAEADGSGPPLPAEVCGAGPHCGAEPRSQARSPHTMRHSAAVHLPRA
jgi:hypothetical protein